VKSTYGYHILFVENYEMQLMNSESDMKIRHDKIKTIIEQKKGECIATEYIENMMSDRSIQVKPVIMQLVADRLNEVLKREPTQFDMMNEMKLTDREMNRLQMNFRDLKNKTLAIIDGKELKVGMFIAMLNYVPYGALHQGFKTALDYVIRDFVLTEEAKSMNLVQKYPFIGQKTRLYEEYRLQQNMRRKIATSVTFTDSLAEKYLIKEGVNNINPVQISKTLKDHIIRQERLKRVTEFIKNLRARYEIKKNTHLIHDYYTSLK
jgi:hypothetical protein